MAEIVIATNALKIVGIENFSIVATRTKKGNRNNISLWSFFLETERIMTEGTSSTPH